MSKLDSLQNKLDMWQRICTMYGTNNLTLTPSDVVQLRQEVAVLYARIAELEKGLNIDTDLTIAGLRKELRDATARIAELEKDNDEFRQLIHDWTIILTPDDGYVPDSECVRQAMLVIDKERER